MDMTTEMPQAAGKGTGRGSMYLSDEPQHPVYRSQSLQFYKPVAANALNMHNYKPKFGGLYRRGAYAGMNG